MNDLWPGIVCLSLAVGFEEDRARVRLATAGDRLRDALADNALTSLRKHQTELPRT